MISRYRHTELITCTEALYSAAGLDDEIATAVATILVEADLLGYDTHGLQFVPAYLAAIEAGKTTTTGAPEILNDTGSTLLLNARQLPGQWVVTQAMDMALDRLAQHPVVCAVMRGSGNISCLATYVKRAALQGAMAILTTSSPGNAAVAPFGGRAPRYSTDPFAVGIPTDTTPILIDTSTAATTNRMVERTKREGGKLAQPLLVDNAGQASDDPAVLDTDPPGAILPAGGMAMGHKGFAFAIMVEALTSGFAGRGRSEPGPGSNVFLQLIDPKGFGGADAFRRETRAFAALCRETPPIDANTPVRMPGDRAMALHTKQLVGGVALHPEILPRMAPLLEKYGIAAPQPID